MYAPTPGHTKPASFGWDGSNRFWAGP
eukprot:SAG11_NODE_22205_length_410_cov_0.832797_1_plen_26_part_10